MNQRWSSFWRRLRRVLSRKPVTYEEAKAAEHRPSQDPATLIQLNLRGMNSGFRR